MDSFDQKVRSKIMRSVRKKNTAPELLLRKNLHRKRFRYRLHDKKLPGSPDIVLPKYKTVIFVNGCFWHRHDNCRYATTPKTRTEWWNKKFEENIVRDNRNYALLKKLGYKVIVIWQCELKTNIGINERLSFIENMLRL